MIYLLSQMVVALVFAVVLGAALGWILHRSTQERESSQFKNVVARQRLQLSQLQSEIAMLTDDYDELQRQSHDELVELRESNQQIPSLTTNLEKSQLLVSQMLKKHESQLRELNAQNQNLTERLKHAESHEQAYNRQQADLDSARRSQQLSAEAGDSTEDRTVSESDPLDELADELSADATADDPVVDPSDDTLDDTIVADQPGIARPSASPDADQTQPLISSARNRGSWASAPVVISADELVQATASQSAQDAVPAAVETSSPDAGDDLPVSHFSVDEDEDLDAVHVVVDEDIQGIDECDDKDLTASTQPRNEDDFETNDDPEFALTTDNSPVIFLNADMPEPETGNNDSADAVVSPIGTEEQQLELPELPELPTDVFDVDPFDQVLEIDDELELGLDGNPENDDSAEDDASDAFVPVERHDDLQQIFGIDPLTEKALNDLGITSYAQLARLKHHEIETIANALQIVPERIERDDWVGNARRQLEDVLEQL